MGWVMFTGKSGKAVEHGAIVKVHPDGRISYNETANQKMGNPNCVVVLVQTGATVNSSFVSIGIRRAEKGEEKFGFAVQRPTTCGGRSYKFKAVSLFQALNIYFRTTQSLPDLTPEEPDMVVVTIATFQHDS